MMNPRKTIGALNQWCDALFPGLVILGVVILNYILRGMG